MFGELLLEALDRKHWLPGQLAQSIGISVRQLSAWLAGRREDLTPDLLSRLAVALDLNWETLSTAAQMPAVTSAARPLIVGISGASCSGKSWLAEKIHFQHDGRSQIVDLDGYYRTQSEVALLEHGYDNPESINADLALADLELLKAGQDANLPVYDYEAQRVVGYRRCEARPLILVEGLFVFADPQLRATFDIKIWVEAGDDLRWSRRIDRDTSCRQLQVEEIEARYERDVLPGYRKYIRPLREHADIIICNNGQDVTMVPLIAKLLGRPSV